ncbi:hypothetical protein CLU97_2416 [Chryseobacterium sp. 7]|uniref:hypothetical protein n=1 Tax=Chryseobacterium sp. 7 TaxID=2035214 RepID=UPI000EABCCA3|nr:hypothetical protein [Chryseobacterium sp. 7]RLJ32946.1 hypothetical protein CLU97_2416 [Chryseobacterium sp. 7]
MRKILPVILFFLVFTFPARGQICTPFPEPFLQSFGTGALPAHRTSQNLISISSNTNTEWKPSGMAGKTVLSPECIC